LKITVTASLIKPGCLIFTCIYLCLSNLASDTILTRIISHTVDYR